MGQFTPVCLKSNLALDHQNNGAGGMFDFKQTDFTQKPRGTMQKSLIVSKLHDARSIFFI